MFQKGEEASAGAGTIIGPSVKVEGDLNANGNIIIEGSVSGNITTDKDITIGQNANIIADVKAGNATIAGQVKGSLNVTGHLSIQSSAKINGDIKTSTIAIESGAQINGMLNMGSDPLSPPADSSDEEEDDDDK